MAETIVVDNSLREMMESVWKTLKEVSEIQKEVSETQKEVSASHKETEQLLKEVSASHKETDQLIKEVSKTQKETEQLLKEVSASQKETEQLLKEVSASQKETDRQMKETDRRMDKRKKELDERIGYLDNRFGEVVEHLVAPGIAERFNELGYHFNGVSAGGHKIIENGIIKAEIDILLENGETIIAVEVKANPNAKDVKKHLKRLETLRYYRRKNNDNRKIQGAMAGAVFGSAQKKAVIDAGLFVIEQTGDTMRIDIPKGFVPREW